MMKNATICIKNLSIGYVGKKKTTTVAKDINAKIYSGELTCLLGANGAGKSTLLRTLSAFQPPLSGSIEVMGKQLSDYTDKQLAKTIGVVLTERCELRNMTVHELVGMGRSPYTGFWGTLGKDDKRIVDESIALVGIEAFKERMVQNLSDGERQKVMIAKALAQQTPIIFLDEPTAFLDYPSKIEILHLLHRLSKQMQKTIFLSTHDLELALQIADNVWLMDKQNGVVTGMPEDLAIEGSLNGFFKRKGVAFDSATGLFRIDNSYNMQICLKGGGCKYAMVQKALRRNGVYASNEVESALKIMADDNSSGYTVYRPNGEKTEVGTIQELLLSLDIG